MFFFRIPDGRWFLLVAGKGHFILATLMEAGGCTEDVSIPKKNLTNNLLKVNTL